MDKPQPTGPAPRRSFLRRALGVALVLGCAAGGAAGGFALKSQLAPPEVAAEPDGPVAPGIAPPTGAPVPTLEGAPLAGRIDTLIKAGSYADALAQCRDAPRNTFGPDEYPLAYREGLCLEGLGSYKEAEQAFAKAGADPHTGAWARAALGRARCALALGSLPAARALADRVLLRSGHPQCRGTKVYAEALHLRARLAVLALGPTAPLDPLDASARAWPALAAPADRYLDWLPTDAPPVSPAPDVAGDMIEVRRAETGALEVTARMPAQTALEALQVVATAADLVLSAPDDIAALLLETVGPVEVDQVPLEEVFAALTERAGVAWDVRGTNLVLAHAAPHADAEETAAALRRALAVGPEHPAAGATRVALANLDARAGRLKSAARGYKLVLEPGTSAPEATHAAYNLGLLELAEGDRGGARARFLEVIDRAPDTVWADLGWCWMARVHLDAGDTAAARAAYRTARGSKAKEVASGAALGLGACALLEGNDDAAAALVGDTKFSTRESHALTVALFEALGRYRRGPTESRREVVLTALERASDMRALGPAGVYLAGRVYAELGQAQQACALYADAAALGRGPLVLRMTFEAADLADQLGRSKEARARYEALASADPDGLGAQAELRLAALDVRDRDGAAAVRRCRALMNRPGVDRAEVLTVMGHGYEVLRKFGHAAACFSGREPVE